MGALLHADVVASERSAPEQNTRPACRTSTTFASGSASAALEPLEQLGHQLT